MQYLISLIRRMAFRPKRLSESETAIMAALRNADEVARQERASQIAAHEKVMEAERAREVRLPLFRDREED